MRILLEEKVSAVVVAVAVYSGKSKKLLDQMLFGILPSKDQGNGEAQNTDNCYHSEDRWNAEFAL